MNIIKEGKGWLAVYKPAGIPTQTASLAVKDLVSQVKNDLVKRTGIRNPYLAVINRLDQPVEGIVLFATEEKTAAVLSKQMQTDAMQKQYLAVICGKVSDSAGEYVDYMLKEAKGNVSKIVEKGTQGAKKAVLSYEVLGRKEDLTLVRIHLQTGRHHQIRVQFSGRHTPLLGDVKYGDSQYNDKYQVKSVALCAYRLSFTDPATKNKVELSIEPKHPMIQNLKGEIHDTHQ